MGDVAFFLSWSGVVMAKKWPELPESMMEVIDVKAEGPSAAVVIWDVLFVTGMDNCELGGFVSELGSPPFQFSVVATLAVLLLLRCGRR